MCFRFIPNNPEASELRGAPFFRQWNPFRNPTHKVYVHDTAGGTAEVASCETWFVLMPSNEVLSDYIRGDFIWRSVVDYHGDVLRLIRDRPMPFDMALAGLSVTDEAWEWWSQPEQQMSIQRSLMGATVVTTPWPELVEPLREINPNVILLPDYSAKKGGRQFLSGWRKADKALTQLRSATWSKDA